MLVSARTGTDFLTKTRLPPLQHVALEVHDSPKSRRTKNASGNVGSWSVAAIHHHRICPRRGNLRHASQQSPERDMQRSWNMSIRELPLRPNIENSGRGASLDLGKQSCPRDMRREFACSGHRHE